MAFASAAHEFRNPLNAIVSTLDILEPLVDQRQGKPYFNLAKNCSNLMLFLIKDILDYSQIESKSLILNMQVHKVRDIIEECLSVLRFKAQEKRIELITVETEAF